jgi:general secretion pathway protein J
MGTEGDPPDRPRRPLGTRAAGFTLIELLVALAIVGLVGTATAAGLRTGAMAWRAETRIIDAAAEIDAADRALRGLIERTDPGTRALPAQVAGEARRLVFTTVLPDGSTAQAAIGVDDRHRLVLRRPGAADALLLDRVAGVAFDYADASLRWAPVWHASAPPTLVRVHVALPRGDARVLPDIVAAPVRAP